ncbi:MAG: GDP-mannose 4,6-dehydratase [Elusimicrobia bacterium HGW-Elusimicrobia-2]|nr:MAG: GDP-mannose 4,6-dehydratase [Elusimicrobia bacterium HGW-Elusimicrobia-2]
MKKALITGIGGQDGSYLAKLLLDKGYEVTGIVRNLNSVDDQKFKYLGITGRIKLLEVNLMDLSNILRVLGNGDYSEVYNLAAQSSVGLSFRQPIGTLEFNTISVANLLEAIRIADTKIKFYQASSSEMYGNVSRENLPVNENSIFMPVSLYGISKASAHWITNSYRKAYGIFASCGILFNHESVFREDNFVTKKIINTAVRISRGLADSLTLGNMDVRRDWGYAPDYVRAMWLMLQYKEPSDIVVCSGQAHSLTEFVETVFQTLDLDYKKYLKSDTKFYRPLDLQVVYGDNSKAKKCLGWEYSLSFEKLIEKLVDDEIQYLDWLAGAKEK